MSSAQDSVTVGSGEWTYTVAQNWAQLPDGWEFREVVAIDVDSQDRAFVFSRSDHPIMVFDRDGTLVDSWGESEFVRPHGLFIDADDTVWCTDDRGHVVKSFNTDGTPKITIGSGEASDTGIENFDFRTMKQAAGPFNLPTNVARLADGDLYVSDGYGNARVHRFSPAGELIASWGEPGRGTGQFSVPHDVTVGTDGRIYICDRENSRIQIFSPDGDFDTEWTDVARPCELVFDQDGYGYVSELGFKVGMYISYEFPNHEPVPARVSVLDPNGKRLASWGSGEYGAPGHFFAAHGIAVDSHGDLYVGEVRPGAYGYDKDPPPGPTAPAEAPVLQKFVRVR